MRYKYPIIRSSKAYMLEYAWITCNSGVPHCPNQVGFNQGGWPCSVAQPLLQWFQVQKLFLERKVKRKAGILFVWQSDWNLSVRSFPQFVITKDYNLKKMNVLTKNPSWAMADSLKYSENQTVVHKRNWTRS